MPFAERPPCACGCKAWTCGPATGWPPFELAGVVSPYFLMGSLPLPRGGVVIPHLADERAEARRARVGLHHEEAL